MAKIKIADKKSVSMPEDFNVADYAKKIFEMYDGETKTVELKCTNELMKVIIDRFGEDVNTATLGSNCFKAIVDVSVSPTFYGWVFQITGRMSIIAPNDVKKSYMEMAKRVTEV